MKIYIGEIVDSEFDCLVEDDICPSRLRHELEGLADGESVELEITSVGGSVLAGNAMISQLREAQSHGHRVVAHVRGIAASMGSAIACAADELVMDDNSCIMIHQPYTMAVGNKNELRKEANTLEALSKTLVAVYRTKFPAKSDEEIIAMMDAETWIVATDAEQYGLKCSVVGAESEPLRIAAKISKYIKNFKKIPEVFNMKNKQIEEEKKPVEEPVEEKADQKTDKPEQADEQKQNEEEKPVEEKADEDAAKPADEEPVEEPVEEPDEKKEEPDADELKKKIEELTKENDALKASVQELTDKLAECAKPDDEEKVTKAECERRVSGMQASLQKQINDFKGQLEQKDRELISARAEVTSLNQKLEESARELSEKASALANKEQALAKLNASVNAEPEELPTMDEGLAKCASPAEKVAFLKSGKYVR